MAITLEIKVFPKSGRCKLKHDKNGQIKFYLKSPPEKGKANKELIKFLAKLTKLPQVDIGLLRGELSRNKTIIFYTINSIEELYKKLGIEEQKELL